ncbi:hypothetical protein LCGC14_1920780 [marine sediment metagenome]|uniref:Uncharacterized protein n=1 Tax=marine sediment metagenome TaxID=412755 RepID=A0A0F9FQP6_9ZZZZ
MGDFPNIVHLDDQQIYANDVNRGLPVGQKCSLPDGRTFRYALADSTALLSGNIQACSAQVGHANNDNLAVVTNVAIGDNTIVITNGPTTWTLDELKGGSLVNMRVEELGAHFWTIYGNTVEAAGSASMTLTLVPGVNFDTVLTASTSIVNIAPSPWSKVIISPTAVSGIPVGVAMRAVTASRYCFLQTGGLGSCKIDTTDTPTVGERLAPSNNTAGTLTSQTADVNFPTCAWIVQVASMSSLNHTQVYLIID